jgi:hypothetical protein
MNSITNLLWRSVKHVIFLLSSVAFLAALWMGLFIMVYFVLSLLGRTL